MEWKADLSEVNGLRNWYGKQPKKVGVAVGMMLNAFAYGTRQASVEQIGKTMTVRSAGFVSRQLRYTKTSFYKPINSMASHAGSVATDRFSGWTEQQTGAPTARKRFGTIQGRGGDNKNRLRTGVRLKPTNEMVTISDFPNLRGGNGNIAGFVAMLLRQKENRLVRIKGCVYKRKRNQLERVQVLRSKQPKQNHWLTDARANYFRKTNPQALWARTAAKVMTPPPKR